MYFLNARSKYLNVTWYQRLANPCTTELRVGEIEAEQGADPLCSSVHVPKRNMLTWVDSRHVLVLFPFQSAFPLFLCSDLKAFFSGFRFGQLFVWTKQIFITAKIIMGNLDLFYSIIYVIGYIQISE